MHACISFTYIILLKPVLLQVGCLLGKARKDQKGEAISSMSHSKKRAAPGLEIRSGSSKGHVHHRRDSGAAQGPDSTWGRAGTLGGRWVAEVGVGAGILRWSPQT